jgi:hypothetical protein
VQVGEKEAAVTGGNKIPSDKFQLEAVHHSNTKLVNGTAVVEYDVAKRFHICVNVQGTLH